MADGFAVDEVALREAARGIRATVEQVAGSATGPVAPLVGHAGLGVALDVFLQRWRVGVRLLAEDGRAMAEQLEADARAYRSVDDTTVWHAPFGEEIRGDGPDPAAG